MIGRREILVGMACVGAAGGAYAFKPRERMSMLNGAKLDKLIPNSFGDWKSEPSDAILVPEGDDSLAAKLYSQTVSRLYVTPTGKAIMLLIAYGDTQSDQLQLHRPEVCYPAFGFNVTRSEATKIRLSTGAVIAARDMTAHSSARTEQITYWTRIGEFLPTSGSEQRSAKFSAALQGIIPDGVLVRISNAETGGNDPYALNHEFAEALLKGISKTARRALVGSQIASGYPIA